MNMENKMIEFFECHGTHFLSEMMLIVFVYFLLFTGLSHNLIGFYVIIAEDFGFRFCNIGCSWSCTGFA